MLADMPLTIEERVAQFKTYYRRENKRPLLGFTIELEYPIKRHAAAQRLPTDRPLVPDDFVVEDYLDDYTQLFEEHEACESDFIFSGEAFWSIPWLEAALGCPLLYSPQAATIQAESPDGFTDNPTIPRFDAANPWIAKAVEFIDKLAEHSAGRFPLGATRMRGVADLMAALVGFEQSFFVLMDQPELTERLCHDLTDFFIAFAQLQLEHIPLFHGGLGSFFYGLWTPAGTIWHQEDASAYLNPQLYEQFILPCDRRIIGAFPHTVMHLHPVGCCPYRQLFDTSLLMQELHVDSDGRRASDLEMMHREILLHEPLLVWGRLTTEDVDYLFTELPPEGLSINVAVHSVEEALAIRHRYVQDEPTSSSDRP